mmetsp:Transcript_11077/g.16184  ORF Transcript_11077/g.16184 Transcript_11077/m.16184 type:complete len:308 (-) Transcript_11077:189-1112(-)
MPEIFVRRLLVATGEFVGECLGANAVVAGDEVVVGDCRATCLDRPHRLTERSDGCGRVEHDFSSVQAEPHPVERVVTTVADVDGDFAKSSVEHWPSSVTLHVVGRLVEVADAGNVVLAVLSNDVALVANYNSSVPDGTAVGKVAFQNGADDDHVVLRCQLAQELGGATSLGALRKAGPRKLLACAEGKRHRPCLLEAEHVSARGGSRLDKLFMTVFQCLVLLFDGCIGRCVDFVLGHTEAHNTRLAHVVGGAELVDGNVKVTLVCELLRLSRDSNRLHNFALVQTVKDLLDTVLLWLGNVGADGILD